MPTLEIDGMRFTGTAQECAAFARDFRPAPIVAAPVKAAPPVSNVSLLAPPKAAKFGAHKDIEEITLKFLMELRSHPTGLPSERVQELLKADHPKGIGSKTGLVNKVLLERGYKDVDAIYTSIRHPLKGRDWFPGPSISDAILNLQADYGKGETSST